MKRRRTRRPDRAGRESWWVNDRGRSALYRQLLRPQDSRAFFESNKLIDWQIFYRIHLPARPAYLQQIDLQRFTQPEVNPKIALRKVATPAADFINLPMRFALARKSCRATHSCANPAAV